MSGISIVFIDYRRLYIEGFNGDIRIVILRIARPVEIKRSRFIFCEWGNIKFNFKIAFIYFACYLIKVFIFVHQAWIIRRIDYAACGTTFGNSQVCIYPEQR